MFKHNLRILRWFAVICLAFSSLSATSQAATKIVMVADSLMLPVMIEATAEGFLNALGLSFNAGVTHYPLGGGYTFEIETDESKMEALTKDPNVLALLCFTSYICTQALNDAAAKDVLVITVTATSTMLSTGSNILRLAPSNRLQAYAIYKRLIGGISEQGRFGVVYEPNAYALDLYKNFVSVYAHELLFEKQPPQWIFSLPLHTYLNLQAEQKDVNAAQILPILQVGKFDAVVYMGYVDGFLDLTVAARGGSASLSPRWFGGDALYPDVGNNAFAGLEIVSLFGVGREKPLTYYYGYDAAQFLSAVAAQYFQKGVASRALFLEIAKITSISGSTGRKNFKSADQEGLFNVVYYDASGMNVTLINVSDEF